jgi:hypothetical protein
MNLLVGDRQNLIISLLQPVVFAALIFLVCNTENNKIKDIYDNYEATKTVMFIVACCNFWMGLYNALSQISQERDIIKREYMVGLSLTSYISSKVLAMSVLGFAQISIFSVCFSLIVGLPENGVMTVALAELMITLFLTNISAAAFGLALSAMAKKQGFSSVVVPLVLMTQLLFSGAIFPLTGALKGVSALISCRWALEGLGSIANLNNCDPVNDAAKINFPGGIEPAYVQSVPHMILIWGCLVALTVAFLLIARSMLKKNVSGRD